MIDQQHAPVPQIAPPSSDPPVRKIIARALGVSLDYLAGLSAAQPDLHPEALRIACEVDALLRGRAPVISSAKD